MLMPRDFRLLEEHQLERSHFPVITFFNAIPNSDFLEVIEQFSLGIGRGINNTICTFPEDLDPDEGSFEGVMFSIDDEEIVVDREVFLYYLEKACLVYLEDYPDKKSIIDTYFDRIKNSDK